MAEAGSFADRVKQQADIVRVIGEYVRLKKSGQNFTGLCPFHGEKTPSFAVHPVKQIFHCFGCGKGGDVFSFVMEMEKCPFPEAVKVVAEKCGIPVQRAKERTPEERKENQQRAALIEIHREAQEFFARQLESTAEGRAARAYLEDRGLNAETIARFGIGYAPSGGDLLLRQLKPKYAEKLLVESGVISRDQSGARLFDRFRRRITFPIANESGKIVAFGCRALGDDQPKYLNSPETTIYSKSSVLYHMDRAKEPIRRQDFAILVEGYMDAIAVARAGISNVVASCGTSLAEPQIKLLGRFTRRVIVNYDPDTAGQAATERSLALLLEHDFEVRVLALPAVGDKKADPDLFIRERGKDEYLKLLKEAPPYVDYLIARQLRIDEPLLRSALSKAAKERRGVITTRPEMVGRAAKPVERRLIRMLAEAQGFRQELAKHLQDAHLYHGLETEKIFAALVIASLSGQPLQATEVGAVLEERDRRLFFEILFEEANEPTWEEAMSCIEALQHRQAEQELADVQRSIEANPAAPEMRGLLEKKQELMRRLAAAR